MSKVVVITGGSSGIGKCTAGLFAAKDWRVYELSRSGSDSGPVKHVTCDVTDENSVSAAIDAVLEREGSIDLLVNNAGFGISGAVESTDVEQAKRLMDVNFFGGVRCAKAVVPFMRKAGSGRIVFVSSVAAPCAIPFQAYYSCAKSSVNTLVCALRNELGRFGISVCAVMPGDIKTGFTGSREKNQELNELYGGAVERAVSSMEKDETHGMAPEKVANAIFKAARRRRVRPTYTVGAKYKLFVFLVKLLPLGLSNWIIGKMYG